MIFEHRYYGHSRVENTASDTRMSFAPDTLRKPTHFSARLARHLPFREAISALHDVVVSDLRTLPKDRSVYFTWLKEQETSLLADYLLQGKELRAKIAPLQTELAALRAKKEALIAPFRKAQRKYFDYLYKENRDAWMVLDPVITVHPDRLFLECFSRDESTYASLSCSHNVFGQIGEFACGTTNIDYSADLYDEFQKIRDYKTTELSIAPEGFQVRTADDPDYIEEKIDLPDSWVRGFLQVSSAMTVPAHTVELHPMDVHNICLILRRHKERVGPRSIRFALTPNQPVKLVFEPWNHEIVCPRSRYLGDEAAEIRIWGRRRLLTLERLIPVANRFTVHLLGYGLPSFWVAEMPDMQYTLGLSGWTANDWSRSGQFDLLAPRASVSGAETASVLAALSAGWFATEAELARSAGLPPDTVAGALTLLTQAGRAIYDIANQVWRLRELSATPLPLSQLRFANPREEAAAGLLAGGPIQVEQQDAEQGAHWLRGKVNDKRHAYQVSLLIDADERLLDGDCQCNFHTQNRLRRGPCEHMLALRQSQAARKILHAH
ncbi:hypothetical protein FACS1894158_01650 [Betaproteobacteria bacterium]|nr:hypothetical protein FACS1894158_01650 [Betaproteobacteria bacterium]